MDIFIKLAISAQSEIIMNKSQALILQALRTPIGSFESKLAALSAPQLASEAIKGLLDRTGVDHNAIQEVICFLNLLIFIIYAFILVI